jgi:hypothetical protein
MNECIVSQQAITKHAEEAARHWTQNAREDAPACPYPQSTEARARWNAAFQRYLVLYSALVGECEEQSA